MKNEVKKSQKNGFVEILRFIFCISVLLFHCGKYVIGEPSLKDGVRLAFFPHGAIGVEFFFIVSGIFMAMAIDKELKKNKTKDLALDTLTFMKKRFMSLFPIHIVEYVILFVVTIISFNYPLKKLFEIVVGSIPSIFFIQMSGVPAYSLNHIEWYISVMLITMAFIYPLCKKYYNTFTKIVAPLISLALLGYIGYTTKSLTGVMVWTGFCYKALLRGISEICLGIFIYEMAKYLKKDDISTSKKLLLTILELGCYLFTFIFIMLTVSKKYEYYACFAIAGALLFTISGITFTSKIFNNKVSYFLGKLSLPIYLSQLSAITFVTHKLNFLDSYIQILLSVIGTVVLSFIVMFIIDLYQKIKNKYKTNL